MNKQTLIAILLTVISSIASAQIYKTTDDKGNPQFTDSPDANATPVHLDPVNTLPPLETSEESSEPSEDSDAIETRTVVAYKTLAISSPENEGIIPNGLSPTKVTADISPALRKGHQLRLLVNGKATASSSSNSLIIPTLNRGTSKLQLQVLAGDDIIQSSTIVTVFVYRPGGK